MHQVLLIGNGFDLAHDAPTSFYDFSIYIKEQILIPMFKSDRTELTQTFENPIHSNVRINKFQLKGFHYSLASLEGLNAEKRKEILMANMDFIISNLKNKFLMKLYVEQAENWFDVETTYFRELVNLKDKISKIKNSDSRKRIIKELLKLNREFFQIEHYLKEYLSSLKIKPKPHIGKFLRKTKRGSGILANELFIIDFNYTQTITQYDIIDDLELEYVPIHGTLDKDIVFGYGNDKDQEYQEIKNIEIDDFLENFKTQKYLLNKGYQFILQKLLTKDISFEVHIIGHSLGLTDKTLLKEIFESENCKKIHIYKRSDLVVNDIAEESKQIKVVNAFTRLTMAATRIVDDELARLKITNFEDAKYFP